MKKERKKGLCLVCVAVAGVLLGAAADPAWKWDETRRPPDTAETAVSPVPLSVTVGGVVSSLTAETSVTVGGVETSESAAVVVNCRPLGLTIYFK